MHCSWHPPIECLLSYLIYNSQPYINFWVIIKIVLIFVKTILWWFNFFFSLSLSLIRWKDEWNKELYYWRNKKKLNLNILQIYYWRKNMDWARGRLKEHYLIIYWHQAVVEGLSTVGISPNHMRNLGLNRRFTEVTCFQLVIIYSHEMDGGLWG